MVDSRKRIAGAFVIGGALVVSAFILGGTQKNTHAQGSVIAADIERDHIEVTDSNGDGVPDWRESLQKTEPIMLDQKPTTTPYERPHTITGRFALNFFEDLLRSKLYGAFGKSSEELITASTAELAQATQDVLFIEDDITVVENTNPQLARSYGNHIAALALSQKSGTENEVIILQDALRYNNPERLNDLEPIAASYVSMVTQMLETPVPHKYVKEHLDLLNAYNAIREDIDAMQKVHEDPLYTFMRMKRYQDDVLGMSNALTQLFDALYLKDAVVWEETESAALLIDVLDTL